MNAAHFRSQLIGHDVLHLLRLDGIGLLERLLVEIIGGQLRSSHGEVQTRSDFSQFDSRHSMARFLQFDPVDSDGEDFRWRVDGERDRVFETVEIDFLHARLAAKEVREEALQPLVLRFAVEQFTLEDQARFVSRREFRAFEIVQRAEILSVQLEFEHVQDDMTVQTSQNETVRTLLAARHVGEQRTVRLLTVPFELAGVFERMDVLVLSLVHRGVGRFEKVKVLQHGFHRIVGLVAANAEQRASVFDQFGFAFFQRTFTTLRFRTLDAL